MLCVGLYPKFRLALSIEAKEYRTSPSLSGPCSGSTSLILGSCAESNSLNLWIRSIKTVSSPKATLYTWLHASLFVVVAANSFA